MEQNHAITVAMIAAQYPPDHGPGPSRMVAFARGLSARGVQPVVFSSVLEQGRRVSSWFRVKDALTPPEAKTAMGRQMRQGALDKLINLVTPMEPIWTRSLRQLEQCFAAQGGPQADVIFTTSNPLASAVGGMRLKRRFGLPLVVEFRDPWSLNPNRNWPTRLHYAIECHLERRVLRAADAVIMNTPTARAGLLARHPWMDANRVHVVSHGYDGAPLLDEAPEPFADAPAEVTIGYAGTFYSQRKTSARGGLAKRALTGVVGALRYRLPTASADLVESTPRTLLQAVAAYHATRKPDMPRIRLEFLGTNPNDVMPLLRQYGLEDIAVVQGWVPAAQVRQRLARFDMLFITNPAIPGSPFVGTKTADFIAAGRPVLAELPDSDQVNMLRRAGAGWVCPPRDVAAMATTLDAMLRDGARALRDWRPDPDGVARLARHNQVEDVQRILQGVLGQHPVAPVISQSFPQNSHPNAVQI